MDQKEINSNYTAVILAAGFGSRISGLTDTPKCLLKVGAQTLLERNFQIWKNLGIKNISLVLGYKAEVIEQIANQYTNDFKIDFQLNEDYKNLGNTHSLYLGIKNIEAPTLIFDADLIYDQSILESFLINESIDESQVLVGQSSIDDIECAKTLIDSEGHARMTIDKRAVTAEELQTLSFAGEAIGILKFSKQDTLKLKKEAELFLASKANQNLNWEHLLNNFLVHQQIKTHMITKGHWVEIDTPEDYLTAQTLFGQ